MQGNQLPLAPGRCLRKHEGLHLDDVIDITQPLTGREGIRKHVPVSGIFDPHRTVLHIHPALPGRSATLKSLSTFGFVLPVLASSRLKPLQGRAIPVGVALAAMQAVRYQSLTLAKVDSLRAWLRAAIGPLCGDRVMACGIGIMATCCAVLEPTRSSRGGMPKYSR